MDPGPTEKKALGTSTCWNNIWMEPKVGRVTERFKVLVLKTSVFRSNTMGSNPILPVFMDPLELLLEQNLGGYNSDG